tara:strand:+ start:1305 stop:4328 length:3024 start_codon:yes stop_codon:yes gene_type:complete
MNNIPFTKDSAAQEKMLNALLDPLTNEVKQQQIYLKNTDELYHNYVERSNRIKGANSTSKYISETQLLKKELYDQLQSEFPAKQDITIFDYYDQFFDTFLTITEEVQVELIETQKPERFKIQEKDNSVLRFQKVFKQFFFGVSRLPIHISNIFRKEKKEIKCWSHKIPLEAMLRFHFQQVLLEKSLVQFEEIQKLKCDARNIKWEINKDLNLEIAALLDEEEISFDELKKHLQTMADRKKIQQVIDDFDQKLEKWKKQTKESFQEILSQFYKNLPLVDTIELDSTIYSNSSLRTNGQNIQIEFKKILNGWRNTQYAQIDDYQVDLELYQLKYTGLTQYFLLENGCKTRISKTTTDFIDTINDDIKAVIKKVETSQNTEEIKELLVSERIKLHHQLENKSVPAAIDALYENNFPNLLERMETKIRVQLGLMKDRRIIYNKETYDAPIPKSNLSHFNPKELVEVDLIGPFSKTLLHLKAALNDKISSTELGLKELVGIVDYNLDAAINSVEGKLTLEEIKAIAKEGLERASSKTQGLADNLQEISEIIGGHLKKELDQLNIQLLQLTENENITNLRIKLAKAKAVERTAAYRKELFDKARNFIPIAIRFAKQKLGRLKTLANSLQVRIGLLEKSNEMTTELSDFLLQSEKAIQQLPYVYRRLYEIKPLEEEGFFEGRTKEAGKLEEAFKHWELSNISSAVIVGEKGSGASSLLNQFVRNHSDSNIIRRKMTTTASSTNAFLNFFDDLFEDETLVTFNGIVDFLNNGTKRIIILEDIQHFYLKKPNGFEAITLLFELISQTAKNIFWLVSTSTFSWSYFQKTIAIERYIRHKIVLSPLNDEQIIKLIMKRHRVSGYNLKFNNSELPRKDLLSSFKKQVDYSQEGLQKSFFTELNDFAQSNISLALLYWLRSAISFEDNTVVIGKIKNIEFNFLTSLDTDSIFTLHSLLLHDTLNLREHAEIFHQAEKQSRMTLMVLEDSGILVSKDGEFQINHLIYRQVVNVLRNKNLIH